ncbi:hypothetical protein CLV41_1211, partial [Roseibium marinum]
SAPSSPASPKSVRRLNQRSELKTTGVFQRNRDAKQTLVTKRIDGYSGAEAYRRVLSTCECHQAIYSSASSLSPSCPFRPLLGLIRAQVPGDFLCYGTCHLDDQKLANWQAVFGTPRPAPKLASWQVLGRVGESLIRRKALLWATPLLRISPARQGWTGPAAPILNFEVCRLAAGISAASASRVRLRLSSLSVPPSFQKASKGPCSVSRPDRSR